MSLTCQTLFEKYRISCKNDNNLIGKLFSCIINHSPKMDSKLSNITPTFCETIRLKVPANKKCVFELSQTFDNQCQYVKNFRTNIPFSTINSINVDVGGMSVDRISKCTNILNNFYDLPNGYLPVYTLQYMYLPLWTAYKVSVSIDLLGKIAENESDEWFLEYDLFITENPLSESIYPLIQTQFTGSESVYDKFVKYRLSFNHPTIGLIINSDNIKNNIAQLKLQFNGCDIDLDLKDLHYINDDTLYIPFYDNKEIKILKKLDDKLLVDLYGPSINLSMIDHLTLLCEFKDVIDSLKLNVFALSLNCFCISNPLGYWMCDMMANN